MKFVYLATKMELKENGIDGCNLAFKLTNYFLFFFATTRAGIAPVENANLLGLLAK